MFNSSPVIFLISSSLLCNDPFAWTLYLNHFIKLLTWAYNDKVIREKFFSTFPIGGWDGTLEDRMKNEESLAKIIAKDVQGLQLISAYCSEAKIKIEDIIKGNPMTLISVLDLLFFLFINFLKGWFQNFEYAVRQHYGCAGSHTSFPDLVGIHHSLW